MGGFLSIFYSSSRVPHPIEIYFNKLCRYHILIFGIVFTSKVPLFWHMLNHMVLSPSIDFYCGGEKLSNGSFTGKKNSCPCKEKVYWDTRIFTKTTHTKYGLYCERHWLVSFSKTMVYVGLLFGVMFFGMMADRFGRLHVLGATNLLTGVAGCLVPLMPEIISFCAMRVIEGLGTGGATVVSYVLMIEYCGPLNREAVSAWYHLPLNISHLLVALISYFIRDCDIVMYFMSVPVILFGLMPLFIMESPKWLVDTGRIEKAAKVMRRVCKFNKKPCDGIRNEIDYYLARRPPGHKKSTIVQCFRYKQIVYYFIPMAFLYFTCGIGYYGVSQYIAEMRGSPHFNIAVSGACLMPGTIVSVVLLNKLNRKPFLAGTLLLAGITLLIVIFLPQRLNLPRVIIACISNCLFFMLFIIGFLYGCEVFPTSVRNSMLGLLSLISRVGQIMSPFINAIKLDYIELVMPFSAFLSAFFLFLAPETKNRQLPATVEEAVAMSITRKEEKKAQKAVKKAAKQAAKANKSSQTK